MTGPVFGVLCAVAIVTAVAALRKLTTRMRAEKGARERAETALRESQRLEAVGRLAGGVAHDFNNLLAVILGSTELIEARDQGKDLVPELDAIREACGRAHSLTTLLLTIGQRHDDDPRDLLLEDAVRQAVKFLRRSLREDISLTLEITDDPGTIHIDAGLFLESILHIAVNAQNAMPEGGELWVLSGTRERNGSRQSFVSLRDTGVGMDATTLSHAFEPYFSTESLPVRSGLGLSTALGTVRKAGGDIEIESTPGKGTTVVVFFPFEKSATKSSEIPQETPALGTGTILLVEDEVSVRQMAKRLLEQAGFEVLTAPGGTQALEIAASHGGEIDVLLTDVIMPGMRGPELARRLVEVRPELGVLYMSGYTADELDGLGSAVLLHKPFSREDLLRELGAAMTRQ